MINALFWNIRGINNTSSITRLKKLAILSMNPDGAAGPYGFGGQFYVSCWASSNLILLMLFMFFSVVMPLLFHGQVCL